MNFQKVKISEVKPNPNNPRVIKDFKFKQLVKSIQDFPEMLELRPIVVNSEMVVLGGNMRLRACKEAGLKEVPIIFADNLTEEQQREFIIKDNVNFGEWDYDQLANEWAEPISDWGVEKTNYDLTNFQTEHLSKHLTQEETYLEDEDDININKILEDGENPYTSKITPPVYEITGDKPNLEDLFNQEKYLEKLARIDQLNIPEEEKEFMRIAATRLIEFDYTKIAEYYAHSEKETQEIMEELALVIIDFGKAIEEGYVKLSNFLVNNYLEEYENPTENTNGNNE